MDDHRFDSLVKALATGTSRRNVFKGLLGLGGAAVVGSSLRQDDVEAARRPTPTPKPPTCPGNQIPGPGGTCTCPASAPDKCGPACCTSSITVPDTPGYSECCDNECCFGHCYGEELCCEYPLVFCEAQNECCFADDNQCCGSTGCCETACCPISDGSNACCEDPTSKCCPGDACIPADGCCTDDECPGCQSCENHICVDDDANCPGGIDGCIECNNATCEQINANCADGNACTNDICNADGTCSNPFDCHLGELCCDDGNACTANVCNDNGTCSNPFFCSSNACCDDSNLCTQNICDTQSGVCSFPFYCTSDACCPAGQVCNTGNGQCFTPCQNENFGSCSDQPCCAGLQCIEIPEVADLCFSCIPSFVGDVPVPCLGFCDLCCSGKSYLGFCVDCGLQFSSCESDSNSCCDGFQCCFSPVTDNYCSLVGTCPLGPA
jgi:hypothetical protein